MVYTNKYELPDGRVVSRQRRHQLAHPHAQDESRRKYLSSKRGREMQKRSRDRFKTKFEAEHGISYHAWYYRNVVKPREKEQDGNKK